MLTAGSVIAKHDRMLPSKSGSNHLFWREREREGQRKRERDTNEREKASATNTGIKLTSTGERGLLCERETVWCGGLLPSVPHYHIW